MEVLRVRVARLLLREDRVLGKSRLVCDSKAAVQFREAVILSQEVRVPVVGAVAAIEVVDRRRLKEVVGLR